MRPSYGLRGRGRSIFMHMVLPIAMGLDWDRTADNGYGGRLGHSIEAWRKFVVITRTKRLVT